MDWEWDEDVPLMQQLVRRRKTFVSTQQLVGSVVDALSAEFFEGTNSLRRLEREFEKNNEVKRWYIVVGVGREAAGESSTEEGPEGGTCPRGQW